MLALGLIAASIVAYLVLDQSQSRRIEARTGLNEVLRDTVLLTVETSAVLNDILDAPSERLAESVKSRMRRTADRLTSSTDTLGGKLAARSSSAFTREILANESLDPVGTLPDFSIIVQVSIETPDLWGEAAGRHVALARTLITQITLVIRRIEEIERETRETSVRRVTTARWTMIGLIGLVLAGI